MLRALFTGVAGLRNHMVRLDVIGNNIANVNTTGYKTGRVQFQDILSQTQANASAPTENKGGKNPMQVGLGMSIASIDNIFTQGSLQLTRKETDLAIQGSGFFTVSDGTSQYFTRAGNFEVDSEGYFVHSPTGYRLQGWSPRIINNQLSIDRNRSVGALNTSGGAESGGRKLPAKSSSEIGFRCNLDSGSDIGTQHKTAITIYDELGAEYQAQFTFEKQEVVDLDNNGGDGTPAHFGPEHNLIQDGDGSGFLFGAADGINQDWYFYDILGGATVPRYAVPEHIEVRRNGSLVTDWTPVTTPPPGSRIEGITFNAAPAVGDTIQVSYREQLSTDDDRVSDGEITVWSYQVAVLDTTLNVDSSDTDAAEEGVQLAGPQQALALGTTNLGGSGVLVFDNGTGRIHKSLTAMYNGTLPTDAGTGNPSISVLDFIESQHEIVNPFTLEPLGGSAPDFDVMPDFDEVTQFESDFTTSAETQDGYTMGELGRIFIGEDGMITGVYTNGHKSMLGQIGMATFNNPSGLFKEGDTMFTVSTNSGLAVMGEPGWGANGKLSPGFLEMSNVDLSNEFTELIVTQRGFQANTRVITTADQILQELVQLKR